ncbi:MAG TPA: hypothetical protein DCR46_04040 [Cytophagales bacterium]|nr:hypothetical protein [Cytophagales bacterium]
MRTLPVSLTWPNPKPWRLAPTQPFKQHHNSPKQHKHTHKPTQHHNTSIILAKPLNSLNKLKQ